MPYVNRFLTNANGAVTFTGNTFGLNKQANANAPGTAGSIGTFFSVNPSSVDGSFPTGTTANYLQNSSSAVLRLPSTTTQILYAELIWGGSYLYGGEDVSAALNNAVTFITPTRTVSVQPDTATRFTLTTSSFYYVRSANVTNLISQAGTYSVLGVPGTQSTTENNANAAGWTLAVVYADPLQKSRNLSVFVGAELTSSSTGSSTAAVTGFGTPTSGTVSGRLLVSAIEGDSAIVGDQLQFGPTTATLQPVSGPNNPINNFFASQINNDSGVLDTSGQFGSLNSTPGGSLSGARQGWDITNIDVSARLSNNQTSAVVRGTTSGDTYVISALALQVDINAPVLNVSKSANVTSARTGDIITYTVQVSNTGTASANVLIATDPLSSATTFIPNSLQVDGVIQTNADIRNGLSLGTLNINQTRILTYQVRVVGPLTSISSLGNQVFVNYQFESTPGNVLTGSGASPVNSVTAINTPPTVPNYTVTNPEDTVAIGTVIGSDIDGNPLTYRIGTRPTNGIVTVNPNGQFVYTPNLNFNGTDQFTVIVDDGQGGTATSVVTIINTPVNDNPVTQNYAVITNEDTPLVGQIQATDVDGNLLTFQLQSPPTNGTVTVTNSGAYTYTPNLNFNGSDQFTVLVSDGQGGTAVSTVTVTVTPVNDAPTVPNYTFSTQEDSPVVGAVVGTDVDGNPLSYQLQNGPTNGIAAVNADGTFSYQPNLNFNGTDQFTVLVSDGQGGTAVSTVTINVIPVNDPPITSNVSFTIAEDSTLINQVVAVDPDGNPLTFSLQTAPGNGVAVVNADGTFSYQPNLNFNGTDQFTVLVSDGQGGTAVSTVTVTVTPVNDAPTVPNYTFSTQEDSPVVGAVVGTDVDGNPLSYQLQNGPTNGIAAVNANGTFSYQPNLNFNGTDQFTVLVSDGQGGTAVSTVTINVIPVNDPPITSNVSFTIAEDSTLINQVVAVDPDGNPLTFSLQTAPGNGVAVVNADGTFSYQPNLNFNGTDQFTVLVSDGQGGTAVSTVTVTVTPVNDAPTVPNYTFSTQEDSPVVGAVVGTDVDGNPLSYQLQNGPTNGIAAVNADGTFSYQPNLNFNGTDQFTVLVSDGQGGTAVSTVTINVIPVNDPPITSNVSFTIAEDSTLINQVVAVDPDGNPLTFSLQTAPGNGVAVVNADGTFSYQPNLNFNGTDQFTVLVSDGQGGTAVSTVTVTVTPVNDAPTVPNYTFSTQEDSPVVGAVVGTDVDGNPLSYQLQNGPTNGIAAVNADGTFSYQPNLNFNGTDQFTVLVSDGQGGTAVSTVTINVIPVNDPPITSNVSFTIAEDSTLINQVVAVDPDGNPLTFSLQTAPGNGVAVVNADGTFSYQPNLNFNGTDQFTVLVSDGQGGTAVSTVTVTVTPVNDAPTVPNYTFSTQEDSPVVGAVVGTDVDGNPLSYQLQNGPTNGIAAVNADGTFSYQPNLNFNGTDQFTVLVSDGQGGTAVSTVTINVIPVNDPPITSNVSFTIAEDSTLINQVVAVDPDGNPLTFSLQTAPGNGVAVVNADGTFSYQPNLNFNGTDQFTVLVSDGQGGTAVSTVTVIVTPVNDAPTVPNYTFSTQEDSPVVGAVVGTDVDGNPLSYQLQNGPTNGIAAVNADGTFSYQPNLNFNGTDQFTVLVSDGQGGTAVSTVTINVIPVNDPPITADLAFTINEDTPLTNQIPAFDPDGDPLTFTLLNPPPSNGSVVLGANGVFTYTPNLNYTGMDTFGVLVSDDKGGTSLSTVTLTIVPVNDPPVGGDRSVTTTINLPVTSSIPASDPDNVTLTYTLQLFPNNGNVVISQDGTFIYTPNNDFIGNDQFTILITDPEGATALSTIFVRVLETNGTTTSQDLQISTDEDTPVTNQIIATNVNGNPLVYTIENQPINGVVTIDSDTGIFTYTPNANFTGSDAFVVYITDNLGGNATSSVIVTVIPINDPPIVPNYQLTTNEDTSVTSMVIATDIDGNPLTYSLQNAPVNGIVNVSLDGMYTYTPNADFNGIDQFTVLVSDGQGGTAISTITITILPVNDPPVGPNEITIVTPEETPVTSQIVATDPDGGVLTYALQDPPTNGVALVNGDGTFTYTPNENYTGNDTFTVLISDPSGAFIVTNVLVTVTPVNDAPVVPDYAFVINEDTSLNSQVVATDVDGNSLTYGLLAVPANGTVVVNPDGSYSYTPNENYNGVDSFSVVVSDGQGGTAISTITITILPVNDPPVGPNEITIVTPEETPVTSQIVATDPDGEVLTYTLQDPPTNGVAVVNGDGTFTYTPNENYTGNDTFTVLISDPSGAFIVTNVLVIVTPVNDAPVVPDYAFVINEDTSLNSRVVATDVDGNPLTYGLLTGPANGTVVVNPDGSYSYTPNENYNGVDSFSVVVSDGQGGTSISTITITIQPVNDPPVGPVVVTLVTNEDTSISNQITALDPDGEVLTYALQDPPTNGVAVVNGDGTFTYTPNENYTGNDTFTVLISDPSGAFIVTNVLVIVTPVNDAPVVPDYAFVINEDTSLNSRVVATDVDGNPLTYGLLTGPANGTVVVNPDGSYSYTPNENYNGVDSFSVVVSDGQGGTSISTITITIQPVNDPPVGPVVVTLVTNEDTSISNQITALDPDGEVLTYALQDPPTNGVAVVNGDGTFTYTPNENYTGNDTFTVLISDPSGAFIVTNVLVIVTPVNDAPVVPDYAFVINEDTSLNSRVVATDVDGNPLTYGLLTGPANGTVVVNPDGSYSYTPNENYNGVDSFSVVVSDGQGGTSISTITITIQPVNDPPVGPVVVTLVTNEDTSISNQITALDPDGEVLTYALQDPPTNGVAVVNGDGTFTYTPNENYTGNDTFTVLISDPSGAFIVTNVLVIVTPVNDAPVVPDYAFVINEDTNLNSQVVATDVDGNPLTYRLLIGPANGTVVVNPDGSYSYTPNENYNGVDSFSVVVSDGQGGTAISTITITILPVNDPPVGPNEITIVTLEETPVTSQIVATDPDGGVLTYALQDPPTNGVAVVNGDGTFTYTPNENYTGNDTFTVRIANAAGEFIITNIFVVVIPVEQPPTVPNYSITTPENQSVTGQVVGSDPNGDLLTYRLGTSPVNGSAVVNIDGSFIYSPNSNYVGPDLFTVIVEDSTGLTAVSIVNVTVIDVNSSPITSDVILQTIENVAISGQVFATDPDDNLLIFSLSGTPFNGTAVVNPDGTFLYTPNPNFIGLDSFTVEVRDSRGASAQSLVTISVIRVNQPPIVVDLSLSTVQGQFVTGQVPAFDPEGDPLVYGLNLAPLNGTAIINSDGTFTYTPNPSFVGTDSFSVFARDPLGNQGFGTITVEVQSQDLPISAEGLTLTTLANQPVSGSIAPVNPAGSPLSYAVAIPPSNGTVVLNQDGTLVYTPNPGFTGEDIFDIVVIDSAGNQSIANAVVTVVVGDRISVVNSEITTLFNTPVSGQVSATNLSGNQLFYTLTSNPNSGSVIVNPDGTFIYTPNTGFFGTDQFQVLVSDVLGNTAVATISVVTQGPIEQAPIVANQALSTTEQQPVTGSIVAIDPQGEALTYTLLGGPVNGILILNPDGTFTYTPNPGFVGTDSFTVSVQNETGLNAATTVQITVTQLANQIVASNTIVRTVEGQSVNGELSVRDQLNRPLTYTLNNLPAYGTVILNPDGTFVYTPTPGVSGTDQFDVLVQNDQGDQAIASVSIIIDPVQSTITPQDITVQTQQGVTVSGTISATDNLGRPIRFSLNASPSNGAAVVNADGTFSYTPSPAFFGVDSFTVLIQNDRGDSAIGIVRIVVQEQQDSIVVTPLTLQGVTNQPVTGQVTAVDALGNPLTYQVQSLPANGTVNFNPDGSFSYTSNPGFTGIDSFTVIVTNNLGQSATTSVTVLIQGVNDPVTVENQLLTTPTGQIIESQIIATDALGRPLTFAVATPPTNGVLVLRSDGTFSYTPNLGFIGQDQFVVSVRNSDGQQAFSIVTINSTASNNIITPGNNTFATLQGVQVVGNIQVTNLLERPLNYTLATAPLSGSVTVDSNGRFVYQPAPNFVGTDTFTVLVRDDLGTELLVVVTVVVGRDPQPPNVVGQVIKLFVNTLTTGQFIAIDPNSLPLTYQAITGPQNGQFRINQNTGQFIYVPNVNFVGTDTVIIRVTNSDGASSEAALTFIVERRVSPAPTPVPGKSNTKKKSLRDPRKTKSKGKCPIKVSDQCIKGTINKKICGEIDACTVKNLPLKYQIVKGTKNGKFKLNTETGEFIYIPNVNFIGEDSAVVQIVSIEGESVQVTIKFVIRK
ncbi:tandem-95 repeat protein (plasmid) [Bacillus sp. H8-1]|uniref:tandem-95 repeat protein n=4 Tax=Priestia TaxID=2800373 RepID=UPI000C0835FF|nr:tandem-95 repeat protein [Priestia aryabhattai]UPK52896.1 tandem-95 repeat protein [Bacillus sp. H8-1]